MWLLLIVASVIAIAILLVIPVDMIRERKKRND